MREVTITSIYRGKKITVEVRGASHGGEISASINGLEGFSFDEKTVKAALARRSPAGVAGATARVEKDDPEYLSGVKNGKITGRVKIRFLNEKQNSGEYEKLYGVPRPSHADIGRYFKDGTLDFTGGGEYSGRATVGLCAVGAIALDVLKTYYGVKISAEVIKAGGVCGDERAINDVALKAKSEGDSVGAEVACVVENCPKGLGGSLFDGLDGKISAMLFSVPAVKGVQFGKGFALCDARGSLANDGMRVENGKITFEKNDDGGIYGGISCGDELAMSVAFKPTPSIAKTQRTVNLLTYENTEIAIEGRHDACVALRATSTVEGVVALAILDEILYDAKSKKRDR